MKKEKIEKDTKLNQNNQRHWVVKNYFKATYNIRIDRFFFSLTRGLSSPLLKSSWQGIRTDNIIYVYISAYIYICMYLYIYIYTQIHTCVTLDETNLIREV